MRYIHCIVRFMSTYDTPIRYRTFYTRYDTYRMIRIAYHTILTTMPIHICSTAGRSQVWVIHSRELAKPVLVAILRTHLWEKHYPHRYYEHELQGFGNGFQNQESVLQRRTTLMEFVCPTLWIANSIPSLSSVTLLQNPARSHSYKILP